MDGNAEAGPSKDPRHTVTLRIPFLNSEHARVAKRALDVDREQNSEFVDRISTVQGDELVVDFTATTVRLLRLASNAFLSSVDLVMRTMEEFAPDPDIPSLTDEELNTERERANQGGGARKGIELRGDGKGAGGGEEVR